MTEDTHALKAANLVAANRTLVRAFFILAGGVVIGGTLVGMEHMDTHLELIAAQGELSALKIENGSLTESVEHEKTMLKKQVEHEKALCHRQLVWKEADVQMGKFLGQLIDRNKEGCPLSCLQGLLPAMCGEPK